MESDFLDPYIFVNKLDKIIYFSVVCRYICNYLVIWDICFCIHKFDIFVLNVHIETCLLINLAKTSSNLFSHASMVGNHDTLPVLALESRNQVQNK